MSLSSDTQSLLKVAQQELYFAGYFGIQLIVSAPPTWVSASAELLASLRATFRICCNEYTRSITISHEPLSSSKVLISIRLAYSDDAFEPHDYRAIPHSQGMAVDSRSKSTTIICKVKRDDIF